MLESDKIHLRANLLSIFFTTLLFVSTTERVWMRQPQFSIELQLTQPLQDGENINFINLFTPSGQGRMLYSFDINNENQPDVHNPDDDDDDDHDDDDDEDDDDDKDKFISPFKVKHKGNKLYLNIRFYTDENGTISEIKQKDRKGFKMKNGQRIHIGNQMLGRSLPGIKEKVEFEGGLTMAGQNLLNGRTMGSLPPAHYTIEVQLYQERNKHRGGELLASKAVDFTIEAAEEPSDGAPPIDPGTGNPPPNPDGGNPGTDEGDSGWDHPDPDPGTDNPPGGKDGENDNPPPNPGDGNPETDEGDSGWDTPDSGTDSDNQGKGNGYTPKMNRRATVSSIYLSTPGGEGRNRNEVINPYPEFRWDGPVGYSYRLVIVKEKSNESPESLIQGAVSTAPFIVKNHSGHGKLLDYEMVDAIVDRPAFQFPTSGVQPLEAGNRYYWQVFVNEEDSENIGLEEGVQSEIWSFRLAAGAQKTVAYSDQLAEILIKMLGERDYQNLKRDGFKLLSISVDGKTLTGQAALHRLSQLKSKVDQGKITLEHNN